MIWYFAIVFLIFLNYPMYLVIGAVIAIYLLYVLSAFLFFINVWMYLASVKDVKKYYKSKWYLIFILPVFNFVVFWIRFAGIINSIKGESMWRTLTFGEEIRSIKQVIKKDFRFLTKMSRTIRKRVNNE